MCFSATANFVGCAVLGTIGVATLLEVRQRRELLLAAVPCLFALHQGIEGFVWLGLEHRLPEMVAHNAAAYVLYAQGILPFLLPLSLLLIEPTLKPWLTLSTSSIQRLESRGCKRQLADSLRCV
jgi:hypothetical protein